MARPPSIPDDVQAKVCDGVRVGLPYAMAALAAGVPERTFYSWKSKADAQPESIYARFVQALKEAEAEGARNLLGIIRGAAMGRGKGQWQAAAWILERRHPEAFGRREPSVGNPDPPNAAESEVAQLLRGSGYGSEN